MTQADNGVWSGEVNRTTGSYFGAPWDEAEKTLARVGTMTFTPSSAIAGTLTYNVNDVNVAKVITRLTLTTPPLGGTYLGGYTVDYTGCNDPSQNGTINGFANYTVTQVLGGSLNISLAFSGNTATCSFGGQLPARRAAVPHSECQLCMHGKQSAARAGIGSEGHGARHRRPLDVFGGRRLRRERLHLGGVQVIRRVRTTSNSTTAAAAAAFSDSMPPGIES